MISALIILPLAASAVDCADERPDELIDLPVEQRIAGLATLWAEARQGFPFFDQVPELDWDQAFESFIPRVLAAGSCYEFYLELQRFFALLDDGHTRVFIPRPAPNRFADVPPVALGLVDGEIVVAFTVDKLADRVPLGSRVHYIDELPAMQVINERVLPLISASTPAVRLTSAATGYSDWGISPLAGLPDSKVELEFTSPQGQRQKVRLKRNLHSNLKRWSGTIRTLEQHPNHGLFHFEWLENDIAYIWLGSFGNEQIVEEFEQHLDELSQRARGIVLDLRGNGGGSTPNGSAILRHLINRPLEGSIWRSRKSVAVYRAWGEQGGDAADTHHRAHARNDAWETGQHTTLKPAAQPIIVPTAVLTGPRTASAAEDFLVYADGADHFTRIGESTRGTTGQPLSIELPGGGRALMVVKRDQFPDGRDFVGVGIIPHRQASPELDDLLAGRDPVLKAALDYLSER